MEAGLPRTKLELPAAAPQEFPHDRPYQAPDEHLADARATDDGVLTLTATIPAGTTAAVLLPGGPAAVVGPGTHTFVAATGGDSTKPELMRSTL